MMKRNEYSNRIFLLIILFAVSYLSITAQNNFRLQRSTPESQGVSSEDITKFVDAANKSKHEFHSFMFIRHGKVIAEGWWKPYSSELKHTMYSVSKSFTSTAIGFAVAEKRLNIEDKVISFFPNDLPDSVSPNLKELRIKHLLSMTAGQDPDPTSSIRNWNTNWVKSFLAIPIINKPGTKFLYNSMATFMLSAIIQKATNEKLINYLKPRLFDPLGIEAADWEINPMDINTGGWGLRVKTEDMAKLGLLYLQKGKWNGKQILPKEWIEEATTIKILQSPEVSQAKRDSSDWLQGYGYKFWRCRHNAFRGDGAFGQYIIVMPDQDAVVAITAESYNLQDELNYVWNYLLPSMKKDPLPENPTAVKRMKDKIESLALSIPARSETSPIPSKITGQTYSLEPNGINVKSISFNFRDEQCELIINTNSDSYKIPFGKCVWKKSETTRRGPNLIGNAKASMRGLPPSKIAGCYSWKDDKTLELILRYIESPHSEKFICSFDDEKIKIEIQNSLSNRGEKTILAGSLLK